jgi:hypothetical protein
MLSQKEELANQLEGLLNSNDFVANMNQCAQVIEAYLNADLAEQTADGTIEDVDDENAEAAEMPAAAPESSPEGETIAEDSPALEDVETESEVHDEEATNPLNERFIGLIDRYNEKRNELLDKILAEEEDNAKIKQSLINEFKTLIQEEEHIGKAFREFNNIRDKWNAVGRVAAKHHHNLQQEYSNLMDLFYYNINIYKQLQEHDLKRNLELKLEVLEELKKIQGEKVMKKLDEGVNLCIQRWNEIGPTVREEWDKLKDEFWGLVRDSNAKIRAYYDSQREQQEANLQHKESLIEKAHALTESVATTDNLNDWQTKTDELIALQEEWKTIGYATRDKNEQVWKQFRKACDGFFEKKRAFFDVIRQEQEVVAKKKEELIAQAEAMQNSQDWKKATETFIQLQKQWKESGTTSQKLEQKLWRKFRNACDYYFNSKKKFFSSMDSRQAENLAQKEAIIKETIAYEMTGDKIKDLAALKDLNDRFHAVDHVPFKEKDRVYNEFRAAMDQKYQGMKMEKVEREKLDFKHRIESLKSGSGDSDSKLYKEEKFTKDKMEKLKAEVIQFENNLGFFANSKGADALKKEVEKKIEKTREEIELLKQKLKMLRNA